MFLFELQQTLGQWQIIFFLRRPFLSSNFIYTVLASGEEHPWNHVVAQQSLLSIDTTRGVQQEPKTEQLDAGKQENA